MSNGLTFKILIQISQNFQGKHRSTCKKCLQNFMGIDVELTAKSAKNTQRWWKLTATIYLVLLLLVVMWYAGVPVYYLGCRCASQFILLQFKLLAVDMKSEGDL